MPHKRAPRGIITPWGHLALSHFPAVFPILILCLLAIGLVGCVEDEDALGLKQLEITMSIDEAAALGHQGDFAGAVEALRPHVSVREPETGALALYGSALLQTRRPSLGVWSLARAAEREDAGPHAKLAFLRALISGGDSLAAIDIATRYLEAEPDDDSLLDLRAQAYNASLQYELALADLEIVAAENPGVPPLVERILNLLILIEDWDAARERIAELGTLLEAEGASQESRTSFCATAAQFEQQRGEFEVAEDTLRGCLEEHEADNNLVSAMMGLLDATDRADEATQFLADLAERFPRRQALNHTYADRLVLLGRVEEADALLLAVAEADQHVNSWIALANLRLDVENMDATAEAVDNAVEAVFGKPVTDPTLEWGTMLAESRFGIGEVYVRAGHYDRAERIIESLADEPALAMLLRGRMLLERGDPQGALDEFQEAFKTYQSNPAARYLAGRAAVEVGDFELALESYQDALRAEPTATDAGFVLAQMLAAEGRLTWALDSLLFKLVRTPGSNPRAMRVLARLAAASALHEYAEKLRAAMAETDIAWAGFALADQARDVSVVASPAEAITYLEGSDMLEAPTHYEAFYGWYRLKRSIGQVDDANARLDQWIAANPDVAGVRMVEGRARFADDDYAAARVAYERAFELNPTIAAAHYEYGQVLAKIGETDAAVAAFDRSTELDAYEAAPSYEAAKALFDADRLSEAAERVRAMLIPHPWHGQAALLALDILKKQGQSGTDEAYAMARRANRYHQNSGPRGHLAFGDEALARDEFETALVAYDSSVAKAYEVADARYGRAKSLVGLGRGADAIPELEALLQLEEFDAPVEASALLETLRSQEEG